MSIRNSIHSAWTYPIRLILLIAVLALITAEQVSAAIIDRDPHVMNPAEPAGPVEMMKPQKLWHVGEEGSDEVYPLGFVTDIQVDAAGNCYLLDSSLSLISVYSPTGEFIRTIGGEGEGPAEFQNASQLILLPNGHLGVIQAFPAKVITLSKDGLPGPHFAVCGDDHGMSAIERAQSAGDFVLLGSACGNFSKMGVDYTLASVNAKGDILKTIRGETEISKNGSINIGGRHDCEFVEYWALAEDGHVFVAPEKDEYRIDVYSFQGELERVIHREYETLARSKEDLAADKKRADEMSKRFGGSVVLQTRKLERDIESLYARPDGELWVASSLSLRECPDNAVGLFDVFSKDGKFLRQVGFEVDYDAKYDDFILTGDLLFILKQANATPASSSSNVVGGVAMISFSSGGVSDDEEGEEIPPSVICYRLQ